MSTSTSGGKRVCNNSLFFYLDFKTDWFYPDKDTSSKVSDNISTTYNCLKLISRWVPLSFTTVANGFDKTSPNLWMSPAQAGQLQVMPITDKANKKSHPFRSNQTPSGVNSHCLIALTAAIIYTWGKSPLAGVPSWWCRGRGGAHSQRAADRLLQGELRSYQLKKLKY